MTSDGGTRKARTSRLSTTAIVLLSAAATLVLGGVGALVGASAETDAEVPVQDSAFDDSGGGPGKSAASFTSRRAKAALGSSDTVTLGDGVVTVLIPPGFEATLDDDNGAVWLSDHEGAWAFIDIYRPDSTPSPPALVSELIDAWLYQHQEYSDVGLTQIYAEPDIDYSYVGYTATATDQAGSVSAAGMIDGFVRADGWVLGVQREAYGASFDEAIAAFTDDERFQPLIQSVGESFLAG